MNVTLSMWSAVIGLFLSCNIQKSFASRLRCYSLTNLKFSLFFVCHGDIESYPGPKKCGNCQHLKFCHWNFEILSYSVVYYQRTVLKYLCLNLSVLCITMTLYVFLKRFLSPLVSSTLDSLNIDGYDIVPSDPPSGSKMCVVTLRKIFLLGY